MAEGEEGHQQEQWLTVMPDAYFAKSVVGLTYFHLT